MAEIDHILQRNIIKKIGEPKQILGHQILLSQPARHSFPFGFQKLPSFLGQFPQKQKTKPVQKYTVYYQQCDKQTLQQIYESKETVYNKLLQVQKIQQQIYSKRSKFNYISFNCKNPSSRIIQKSDIQLKQQQQIQIDCNQGLQFSSEFQSGNLSKAYKMQNNQFDLILQFDINTRSYTQWFFFKVNSIKLKGTFRFNIVNMYKASSLYRKGMRVMVFNTRLRKQSGISWHRGGQNIRYYSNNIRKSPNSNTFFQTLSFQYTFQSNDQVFFAYSYPFTYTQLNNKLDQLQKKYMHTRWLKRQALCYTLANNRVDMITITGTGPNKRKKVVFITARVHPGQTVSSFVMKGVIDYLLSNDPKAIHLRKTMVFKIIPMLNPDGVIHGNYRSNLSGNDLNRHWLSPNKDLHSQIYYLKKQILKEKNRLILFCDLHGHSKKKNMFVDDPSATKALPFLLSKLFQNFSFQDCSFQAEVDRQGTARQALFQQLQIPNVFTLESSFCGPLHDNIHFSTQVLQQMGRILCKGISLYLGKYRPPISFGSTAKSSQSFMQIQKFIQQSLKQIPGTKNQKQKSISGSDSQQAQSQQIYESHELKRSLPYTQKLKINNIYQKRKKKKTKQKSSLSPQKQQRASQSCLQDTEQKKVNLKGKIFNFQFNQQNKNSPKGKNHFLPRLIGSKRGRSIIF